MKIVFPMLIVASAIATSAVRAEPFDCNGFPDFRARMNCYEVTSRGPKATEPSDQRVQTANEKPARPRIAKRRKPQAN